MATTPHGIQVKVYLPAPPAFSTLRCDRLHRRSRSGYRWLLRVSPQFHARECVTPARTSLRTAVRQKSWRIRCSNLPRVQVPSDDGRGPSEGRLRCASVIPIETTARSVLYPVQTIWFAPRSASKSSLVLTFTERDVKERWNDCVLCLTPPDETSYASECVRAGR